MAALSSGEILAIVVSVVLFLFLIAAIYICRLVYLHVHDNREIKDDLKKKVLRKMRSTASTDSMTSGSTDYFVDRREFEQMFSGLETTWQTSVDDIEEGLSSGEFRIDNPAFDSERGRLYEAAVVIQSVFRGYSYGLIPVGQKTNKNCLLNFLAQMRKKNAGKSTDRYRQICLTVSGKSLKVLPPTGLKIKHSLPLNHVLSYAVDITDSHLFGVIFSRKGLNYCLGVICTSDDAAYLLKSLEEAQLLQQLRALSLSQQAVLSAEHDKRDSRQSVTELLATLPGGEKEAQRSAKQAEKDILPGSSFRNSQSSSQQEEVVASDTNASARSTLKAHRELSEEDLLAATHLVLEKTLQNTEHVISSLQSEKEQVMDLVLSDSTMGLLEDTKSGTEGSTRDVQALDNGGKFDAANQAESALQQDDHGKDSISQVPLSPKTLGDPIGSSTPLKFDIETVNAKDADSAKETADIGQTIRGLLDFGETTA